MSVYTWCVPNPYHTRGEVLRAAGRAMRDGVILGLIVAKFCEDTQYTICAVDRLYNVFIIRPTHLRKPQYVVGVYKHAATSSQRLAI